MITFRFQAKLDIWEGPLTYYVVELPKGLSAEIHELFDDQKRGWGSLPVKLEAKGVAWTTSIFPLGKKGVFFFLVKAQVRKQAGLKVGERLKVKLTVAV